MRPLYSTPATRTNVELVAYQGNVALHVPLVLVDSFERCLPFGILGKDQWTARQSTPPPLLTNHFAKMVFVNVVREFSSHGIRDQLLYESVEGVEHVVRPFFLVSPKCPNWQAWWDWRYDKVVICDVKFLHEIDLRTIELLLSVEFKAHKNNIRRNVSDVIVQSLKACSPMSTLNEVHRYPRIEASRLLPFHLCDHVIRRDRTLYPTPAAFTL